MFFWRMYQISPSNWMYVIFMMMFMYMYLLNKIIYMEKIIMMFNKNKMLKIYVK